MRQQINLNKCVGITKDGELIMVDYFFDHGDGFRGVTGTRFVGVTQSEIDERNDPETATEIYELDHHWKEAVQSGNTTMSLEDYVEDLINNSDGYYFGHDTSYINYIPKEIKKMHYDGCETFECIGGGRMFPLKEEMLLILDQDLWDALNAFETDSDFPIEAVADLLDVEAVSRE